MSCKNAYYFRLKGTSMHNVSNVFQLTLSYRLHDVLVQTMR